MKLEEQYAGLQQFKQKGSKLPAGLWASIIAGIVELAEHIFEKKDRPEPQKVADLEALFQANLAACQALERKQIATDAKVDLILQLLQNNKSGQIVTENEP